MADARWESFGPALLSAAPVQQQKHPNAPGVRTTAPWSLRTPMVKIRYQNHTRGLFPLWTISRLGSNPRSIFHRGTRRSVLTLLWQRRLLSQLTSSLTSPGNTNPWTTGCKTPNLSTTANLKYSPGGGEDLQGAQGDDWSSWRVNRYARDKIWWNDSLCPGPRRGKCIS